MKYLVRQYRPAYFSGFVNKVYRDVDYDDITKVEFMANFRHEGFKEFKLEPYGGEVIISAHYDDGKHWVVGFALAMDSNVRAPDGGLLRDNWRYRDHES
jgi:hypothetical protein